MNALQSWMIILLLAVLVSNMTYLIMLATKAINGQTIKDTIPIGTIVRHLVPPHQFAVVVQVRANRVALLDYPSNTWYEVELKDFNDTFEIITDLDTLDMHDKTIIRRLRGKAFGV